jgi:predicted acylesterase/phospholipase RssA
MENISIPKGKIKYISFSGGATWGFNAFGMMYHAIQTGFINMDNIEHVFATSVGSLISVILLLKIDLDIIKNYIIKRPWDQLMKISINTIIDSYQKKGIYDKYIFKELFLPLFKSVDLSENITLYEFYEYTGVELHIYTTEINQFEIVDLSYKTHPDWLLIDAVYASCTIPNVFTPIFLENQCYLDGGIFVNNPIYKCIEHVSNIGGNTDDIFSISMVITREKNKDIIDKNWNVYKDTNLFDFNRILIRKLLHTMQNNNLSSNIHDILYEIKTECHTNTLDDITSILNSSEIRKKLIENGIETMKERFQTLFINLVKDSDVTLAS